MINPWIQFQKLVGNKPTLTGTVTTHNVDGSSTLSMTGGGTVRAIGQDVSIGAKAFVRGNEIVGQAPDLTAYNLEV